MNITTCISNFFQPKVPDAYKESSKSTVACGILNGAVSVEMGLRAIGNLFQLVNNPSCLFLRSALSANLGGSVFYGLCATNQVPGSPAIGASLFSLYSIFSSGKEYTISKITYEVFSTVCDVLEPIVKRIDKIVLAIFETLSLPAEPIWLGVALIVTAILVTKYVLPYLFPKSENEIAQRK